MHYEMYAIGLRNPTSQSVLGELLGVIRQMFTQAVMEVTGGTEQRAQALAAVMLAMCYVR